MTRTAHHTKWQSLYIASIKHRKREREQGRGGGCFLFSPRRPSFFFFLLFIIIRSFDWDETTEGRVEAFFFFFWSEETLGHTTPDTNRLPITSHKNVRVQNPSTHNWPFNSNWSEVRILFINFFFSASFLKKTVSERRSASIKIKQLKRGGNKKHFFFLWYGNETKTIWQRWKIDINFFLYITF